MYIKRKRESKELTGIYCEKYWAGINRVKREEKLSLGSEGYLVLIIDSLVEDSCQLPDPCSPFQLPASFSESPSPTPHPRSLPHILSHTKITKHIHFQFVILSEAIPCLSCCHNSHCYQGTLPKTVAGFSPQKNFHNSFTEKQTRNSTVHSSTKILKYMVWI